MEKSKSSDCLDVTNTSPKRCCHWVLRKKRYCKLLAVKDGDYCGEHEPLNLNAPTDTNPPSGRIPCPLDNKHTVRSTNLRKHLQICNAREMTDCPEYIIKNVNVGLQHTEETDDNLKDLHLSSMSEEEIHAVIAKVTDVYRNVVKSEIGFAKYKLSYLRNELDKTDYGKETRKHLWQTAALLNILQYEDLIRDSTTYVEFGSGKGQLAFYLAEQLKATKNSQVILLDRKSLRHKKDNKIEDRSLVQRIRVDIADVVFDKLPTVAESGHCVALSKHLCGVATDLTLKCITQAKQKSTDFIMIAVCCHHRCEWNSYVGREFLLKHKISKRDFAIISRLVGWAVCGTGMSRERRKLLLEHKSEQNQCGGSKDMEKSTLYRLPLAERESIGFMCKRILDYGRVHYLQLHNYAAELNYYVPKSITLENVIIMARKL